MIGSISNNEAGSSVRYKINAAIAAVQELLVANDDVTRSSGTLADDPTLSVTIPAGEQVIVEYWLLFNTGSASTDNLVMNWSAPAAPSGFTPAWSLVRLSDGQSPGLDAWYGTWPDYSPPWASGLNLIHGTLSVANDSGTDAALTLRWANSSGVGNTTRKAGSWIAVRRSR